MQMTWTDSFKRRVLLNASKAYVAQTEKGMNYASLQPVYALNFVNATFLNDVEDYYHYYHLVHDRYTDKVIDGLHLIFVELPKFKPTTFSERKMQVLWLRFLTEINENTREVPADLLENAEVSEALEIVERAAFTDEEMRAYDKFWDRVSTQRTWEEGVLQKAEAMVKEAEAMAKKAEAMAKKVEAQFKEAEAQFKEAEAQAKEAEAQAKEAEAQAKEAEAQAKEAEAKAEAQVKEAEAKAEAQVKEAGAKSRAEERMKNARSLKKSGIPLELIANSLGLTTDEIAQL